MTREEQIADKLYNWLRGQKYGDESLLHAAVTCDHAGSMAFKRSIATQIDKAQSEIADAVPTHEAYARLVREVYRFLYVNVEKTPGEQIGRAKLAAMIGYEGV